MTISKEKHYIQVKKIQHGKHFLVVSNNIDNQVNVYCSPSMAILEPWFLNNFEFQFKNTTPGVILNQIQNLSKKDIFLSRKTQTLFRVKNTLSKYSLGSFIEEPDDLNERGTYVRQKLLIVKIDSNEPYGQCWVQTDPYFTNSSDKMKFDSVFELAGGVDALLISQQKSILSFLKSKLFKPAQKNKL